MTRLDQIPTAFEPPADARPSEIVARLRAIRPSRRTVVRGLVIGAAAAALVPLDWYLARRESAAAPAPEPDDMSEHLSCRPESYNEEGNNWPASGPAVCYGGYRRGSYPCAGGYHREGTHSAGGEGYHSTRLTTNCNGRNAWRWQGYRCSDAITQVTFADGTTYNGTTIAACEVLEAAAPVPAPAPAREPAPAPAPTREPAPAPAPRREPAPANGSGGGDPSRPRRIVPDLGLRSLPGIGTLTGR